MFELALRLNKSLGEIEALPAPEISEWLAFFSVKKREADEAALMARADSKAQQGRDARVQAHRRR